MTQGRPSDEHAPFRTTAADDARKSHPPQPQPVLDDGEEEIVDPTRGKKYRAKARVRRLGGSGRLLVYSTILGGLFVALPIWALGIDSFVAATGIARDYFAAIPVAVLLAWAVYSTGVYFSKQYRWPTYLAEAAQFVDTEKCVEGFISLFRTYARTRQIGTYTFMFTGWGLYAALFLCGEFWTRMPSDLVLIAIVVGIFALTALNFYIGLKVSTSFVVGTVVVDTVSEMSYRAANPYQDADAKRATRSTRNKFRQKYYWWFN